MRPGVGPGGRGRTGAGRLRHGRGLCLARVAAALPRRGSGKWNLAQYVIARGSDLPLHDLEVEVLPPIDSDERPKGVAEIVMIPVAPALLNAIYDATGQRFRSLPVTQSMIKGVLK